MATPQQFQDAIDRLNAATTKAGQRIADLVQQLKDGGLSATEETAVLDQLSAVAAALEPMGGSVTDPVPVPVPDPIVP